MKKQISVRVDDDTYQTLVEASRKYGCSLSEFMHEALFNFLVDHKDKISKGMSLKFLQSRITKQRRELFFMKNGIVAIYQQAEFRYRLRGDCEHEKLVLFIQPTRSGSPARRYVSGNLPEA